MYFGGDRRGLNTMLTSTFHVFLESDGRSGIDELISSNSTLSLIPGLSDAFLLVLRELAPLLIASYLTPLIAGQKQPFSTLAAEDEDSGLDEGSGHKKQEDLLRVFS